MNTVYYNNYLATQFTHALLNSSVIAICRFSMREEL